MQNLIEVEEAIEILKNHVNIKTEIMEVDLLSSNGYILAEDIYAPISVPNFPKAAMDGYAIKSSESLGACTESPIQFEVIGELFAGEYKEFNYKPNKAIRIMTGAYIPDGFDCIIKQEDTNYGEIKVEIYREMNQYENYCKVGEDVLKDNLVINKYTRLTSIHIGTLASLGIPKVKVIQPVKVGIISTGNELIRPGEQLETSKVYDSISFTLAARMISKGIDVVCLEQCEDDIEKLTLLIEKFITSVDILITTGGVSVGKKDILPDVMEKFKTKLLFKKVHMQPGTPVMANMFGEKIILSISGNPFAALANFEILFWPMVSKLLNNNGFENQKKNGILLNEQLKISKSRRFYRAYYEDGYVSMPEKTHSSSVFSNLMKCNCLMDIPKDACIKKGDRVKVLYFNGI